MNRRVAVLCSVLFCSLSVTAQQDLPDAPVSVKVMAQSAPPAPMNTQSAPTAPQGGAGVQLSLKQAEAIALKQNPTISVARLRALASQQVTREVRSNLWPTAFGSVTAVDAHDDSRISAGGLNNPIIFERAALGTTVSQLIADFGHTTNLVASARFHEKAEDQNAVATKEQILLAVDQAFYAALQAQAVLRVAQQTVDQRQLTADQVAALTQSKLKSGLDLSFANVNLAQAKLLLLDAQNNQQASLANLSALLGYSSLQNIALAEDNQALSAPPAEVDPLISEAFSKRPEILALEFESQSREKFHRAERDQLFPTISALGAIGKVAVGDGRLSDWYGAVGVNVQVPIFNGFLYTARSREAELRAEVEQQQLTDLRNRIARDVRNSWLEARTAYERVTVNQQLLDQANRALDLAQARYKLGLGSIVELSQAQLQQTQAQIGEAQAGYEYRLAMRVLSFQTVGL